MLRAVSGSPASTPSPSDVEVPSGAEGEMPAVWFEMAARMSRAPSRQCGPVRSPLDTWKREITVARPLPPGACIDEKAPFEVLPGEGTRGALRPVST